MDSPDVATREKTALNSCLIQAETLLKAELCIVRRVNARVNTSSLSPLVSLPFSLIYISGFA